MNDSVPLMAFQIFVYWKKNQSNPIFKDESSKGEEEEEEEEEERMFKKEKLKYLFVSDMPPHISSCRLNDAWWLLFKWTLKTYLETV